ncbi:MAG: response regulator [Proteobacteria bacterium]|nr:response regulator [Pseudomonadota bacterium]
MSDRQKILVVDDELGPRESLRMILKPSYDVVTIDSGAAALEYLEDHPVDLITLDLKMPGMSGLDTLEQIRQSNPEVMVIIVTGYGTFKSVVEAIRLDVFDYISKPFNVPEIMSVVQRCLDMRNTKSAIGGLFQELAGLLKMEYSDLPRKKIVEKIEKHLGNFEDLEGDRNGLDLIHLTKALSRWIEKGDPYTIGHSERVSHYAYTLAEKLDLSDSFRKELQLAANLHDIGKVSISSRFMNTEGKLSSTDWAILKRHPIKSIELIRPLNLSKDVVSAIRHHHERFDGTGYPDGLAGTDIPMGAQIISIGNIYDVLTSKRPYRTAMSPAEAEAEIQKNSDTYFDPDLTRRFLEVLRTQRSADKQFSPKKRKEREGSCQKKQLVWCVQCNALALFSSLDQAPEYEKQKGEWQVLEKDDQAAFISSHQGHHLEELHAIEDSFMSDGNYAEPIKTSYFEATNGKQRFVVKRVRERIHDPQRYELIPGKLGLTLRKPEIDTLAIQRQLERESSTRHLSREKIHGFVIQLAEAVSHLNPEDLKRAPFEGPNPSRRYFIVEEGIMEEVLEKSSQFLTKNEAKLLGEYVRKNLGEPLLMAMVRIEFRIEKNGQDRKLEKRAA